MLKEVIKICCPEKGGLFYLIVHLDQEVTQMQYYHILKQKLLSLDRDLLLKNFQRKQKKIIKIDFTFHNKKFSNLNKVYR